MNNRTFLVGLQSCLLTLLLLTSVRATGQSCQTVTLSNKVGDSIVVTATLLTTDPNENGEDEVLSVSSSGGEITATISSYNLSTPVTFVATLPNEAITGSISGADGDESCNISATVNPAPAFTPAQKHTANQGALATGLTGIGAGLAFTILCGNGITTLLCGGLLALSSVTGASSLTLGYIGSDPSDPNYTQIAHPVIQTLAFVQPGNGVTTREAAAFNQVAVVDAQMYGVGIAAYTSANRAQGAKDANNKFWERQQIIVTNTYNVELSILIQQDVQARLELATALQAAGVNVTITPSDVLAEEQQIASSGLPPQMISDLKALGVDEAGISQITQQLIVQDTNASAGQFPDLLISPNYLGSMNAAAQAFAQNPPPPLN